MKKIALAMLLAVALVSCSKTAAPTDEAAPTNSGTEAPVAE